MKKSEDRPHDAKIEAASEILKRSITFDLPPLTADVLLHAADDIFLKLDEEESVI